jgi:hypothetical protein
MTCRADMPGEDDVRHAVKEIIEQSTETGRRPSVLAAARRFGMSNTTFRRNFPEIAREIGELRRTPAFEVDGSADAQRYVTLSASNVTRIGRGDR